MTLSVLIALAVAGFASHAYGQFDTDLTIDPSGTTIYVAAGSTSRVAAPDSTPTLVYNCWYMPLICENVANFAKDINPAGGGDLGAMQLFYFDPDESHKKSRRAAACGCFQHDNCPSAVSNGKQVGTLVTQIANRYGLTPAIDLLSSQTILAGPNPGVLPNTNNAAPRASLSTIPGRFFGQGVAFSCDEFPAATFINGGSTAKTICALQSWQIFSGPYNPTKPWMNAGKWPLPTGERREQDWQASSHRYLRQALGIGASNGLGTVYPFYFTTTGAQAAMKAWVVSTDSTTKTTTLAVNKRDGNPTFTTYTATTTVNVFGDEELEPEHPFFKDHPVNDVNENTGSALKIPPNPRFRRQFAATQTSTVSSSSDAATSLVSSRLIYGTRMSSATSRWANSSATTSSAPSTLLSASAPSSDFGTGASSTALGSESPSTTASNASSNSLRSSISPPSHNSILVTTASLSAINSSAIAGGSLSVGVSRTASATRTSPTPGPSTAATSSGVISTSDLASKSSNVTASALKSSGITVAGNPVATSSASAVSSNVASASSAAAALVANPSNSENAQAAQQQINNATEAASAMLAHAVPGSPLADALLSLIGTLGTAASAANAAVDATTPAEVSAAASELFSDLSDASNNAEHVKEKAKDDPSDSPSTPPSASEASPSTASEASSTTTSSQSTPSSITSSASSASSSAASSSTTSSSASAGPSVCTLAFDEDGAEDIEVGDDYTDGTVYLDPDTADDVPCMPIYGAGGAIIPCDASVPSSDAFSSAASTVSTAISFTPYSGPVSSPTAEISPPSIIVISTAIPFTPAPSPRPSHKPNEHIPPPPPWVGAGRVD